MATISENIAKTQLRKKYGELLSDLSKTDEDLDTSCDNEKFAPLVEKALGLRTTVIHNIEDVYVPFAYCSNETDELNFVYDDEDLKNFEDIADFDQGMIVIDLTRL